MKKRLLVLASVFTAALFILATIGTVFPPRAYAAIPSDAQLKKQGEASAECRRVVTTTPGNSDDKKTALNICVASYVAGYKDTSPKERKALVAICIDKLKYPRAYLSACVTGYEKGQKDRKTADAEAAKPPPAPGATLSQAEIKKLAENTPICAALRDSSGDASGNANFGACVKGYIGGYQNKGKAATCGSDSLKATCEKGYDVGVTEKEGGINSIGQQTTASANTAAAVNDSDSLSLDCNAGFNPLNWLICGAVKGMVSVLDGIDKVINNLLSVGTPDESTSGDPSQIFETGCGEDCKTGDAYHKAWVSFRNIALGLLVISGLVMIIAQALGMEILDAYTIRKVLPRLIIVSIAITLSWPILRFIVQLFNDLGYGVRFIIESPFKESLDNTIKLGGGSGTAVALATPVAFMALGIFGLLTFVGSALLAALIAFLVLVIRQVVVILLVITAPIAFVCYILPNTQKAWKLWLNSFGGALLMFPIIAAMIAAGRAFASVANNGGSGDTIGSFIAFAAYFGPYFLIPATFKFAGGALRQIGGFVNDRGRGGFDRLRKARQENIGKRVKAAQTGGIYRNDFGQFNFRGKQRSIGRMANTLGNYTLDAKDSGRVKAGDLGVPGFGRYADVMKDKIDDQTLAHSRKAAQDLDLHYQSGRALSGQMQYFKKGLSTEASSALDSRFGIRDSSGAVVGWRAPTGKNEIEDIGRILGTSKEDGARLASRELLAKAGTIGDLKGAGKEETQRADIGTIGMLAAASAGRLENDELADIENKAGLTSGLTGMSSGFAAKRTALLQQIATQKRTEQSRGHGIQYEMKDGQLQAYSVYRDPTSAEAQTSAMRITAQDLAGSKSEAVDALANTFLAGASDYEMRMGTGGKLEFVLDTKGEKVTKTIKTGPSAGEVDDIALGRAKALRSRIQYLAQYSQGDSDMGRKLAEIAEVHEIPVTFSQVDPEVAKRQHEDRASPNPLAPPDPPAPRF